LEKLKEYEELLRKNHIQFEPLHSSATARSDEARRNSVGTVSQEMEDKGSGERGTEQVKSVSPRMTLKSSSIRHCGSQTLLLKTGTN
jgi:hypothetical protein